MKQSKWMLGVLAAAAVFAGAACSNNNGTGGSGDVAKDQQNLAQTEQQNQKDMAQTRQDAQNKVASAQNDANHEIAEQQKQNNQNLADAQNDLNKDRNKDQNQAASNDNNGKALTAQAGVVTGRVTDLSDKTFTVKVPNGDSVEIQKSTIATTSLRKGEEVRATYRVDTDGNKVAQDVTVIRATTSDHANQ